MKRDESDLKLALAQKHSMYKREQRRADIAEKELAAIQSWCESHHNGYSEAARNVMHELKRPKSIIQCLDELFSEESEMRIDAISLLVSKLPG